jgi:hypothetical protein
MSASENKIISHIEVEKLENDSTGWNVPQALGYISQVRTRGLPLRQIHDETIGKLIPGEDYEANKKMLNRVFDYLTQHSEEFGLKVE